MTWKVTLGIATHGYAMLAMTGKMSAMVAGVCHVEEVVCGIVAACGTIR